MVGSPRQFTVSRRCSIGDLGAKLLEYSDGSQEFFVGRYEGRGRLSTTRCV